MAADKILQLEKFTGLYCSGDGETEIPDGSSPNMTNFRITPGYKLKRRDGFRVLKETGASIRGIACGINAADGGEYFLAVSGTGVLSSNDGFDTLSEIGSISGAGKVSFFEFGGSVYILGETEIKRFNGTELSDIVGYRPKVTVSTPPSGGGTLFESPNLLTGSVTQCFTPDGASKIYKLALSEITSVDGVRYNGIQMQESQYTVNAANGTVTFINAPAEIYPDCLEIDYTRVSDQKSKILKCRYAVSFGGANDTRAFLWGNPDYPAVIFYSGIANGKPDFSYFPEENFNLIGSGAPVTSLVRQYDRLIIYTAGEAYYSYIETVAGADGIRYASFPVNTLSGERGNLCEGPAQLMDNVPVTFSHDGLYKWISTNIRDERNARLFSHRISELLLREASSPPYIFNRKAASELFTVCGTHSFVYNYALDVFYKYTSVPVIIMCEGNSGELYFADTSGRICATGGNTDAGDSIKAEWYSKYFDFGSSSKVKNIYGATAVIEPDENTKCEMSWASDKEGLDTIDGKLNITLSCVLFSFADIRFDSFSFESAYTAKLLTRRLSAKRFTHFRVIFRILEKESGFHLLKLLLRGRINDMDT
ncbi:MAG: hypothetical protein VB118_12100 [Oscillospiraceae bacterium]|nr:hypothetical protein [Oscillospiraceae bacterium]